MSFASIFFEGIMHLNIKKAIDLYIGGTLIIVLRPIVILFGKLLKRDHSLIPQGDITIIKLLGGGSLVIGLPALYAIKKAYPHHKLQILTTKSIAPFAKTLHIFDEILILDDSNILKLLTSSLSGLKKLFRTDTIIDWEVYSRLTTIFALFSCARNRIGFYREDVKSRTNFSTHLVFFNLYYGSWYFYEELSQLIGAQIPPYSEVRNHFKKFFPQQETKRSDAIKIGIGHSCSDLSKERMLTAKEWEEVFIKNINPHKKYKVYFFGAPQDSSFSEKIIQQIKPKKLPIEFFDRCGKTKLTESLQEMTQLDEFWAIDSALLHYARLMNLKMLTFFGPTSPHSLLKPIPNINETINYKQVHCSPCVHVTESPPCKGDNICIKNLFSQR